MDVVEKDSSGVEDAQDQRQRYETWMKKMQKRMDDESNTPKGMVGEPGGFVYINKENGAVVLHKDKQGQADGILIISSLPGRESGHLGGRWQYSVFVPEKSRGKRIGSRLFDLADGQLREKLRGLGLQDGSAVVINRIFPPGDDPDYGRTYKWMRNYFLDNGYWEIGEGGSKNDTVYRKEVMIDPGRKKGEVRRVNLGLKF